MPDPAEIATQTPTQTPTVGDSKEHGQSNPSIPNLAANPVNPLPEEYHFLLRPYIEETYNLTKTNRSWKVHTIIVAALSCISFFIWFAMDWIFAHYAWFYWVWGSGLMSLSLHYFMFIRQPRQHFQWHLSWFLIVNAMFMLTWLCTGGGYLWWLIVTLSWGHLVNIHYQLTANKTDPHKYIKMHKTSFLLLQAMLFFIWVQSSTDFPWFLITFFAVGFLYAIHFSLHYYPKNLFKLHVFAFTDIQIMLFVIWAATGPSVPWFIFPLFGWGALLYVHYKIHSRNRQPLLPVANPQEPTPVPQQAVPNASSPIMSEVQLQQPEANQQSYGTNNNNNVMYPQVHYLPTGQFVPVQVSPYPYLLPPVNNNPPK